MTTLEQIARALAARRRMTAWDALDESDRTGFRLDAVQALQAMLWPTQAMVDAVDMPLYSIQYSTEEVVALVWRAMIEAALREG